jgi:hypothetical protein
MRGGRAQLSAKGVADAYLTGDPRITYWKTTFRRHALFATESIAQPFEETPDFGRSCRCVLGRHGDLVGAAWLEIRLPDLWTFGITPAPPGNQTAQDVGLRWVNSVGHAMIRSVRLRIGDAVLDEHPGEWLDILSELSESEEKRRSGLERMVGKRAEADFHSGLPLVLQEGARANTYYVPLKFCYNLAPGLYLPLAALGAQEVSYEFEFMPYVDCVTTTDPATTPVQALASLIDGSPPRAAITLWAEYVILDEAERLRLIERPRDLLVEKLARVDHAVAGTAATAATTTARYDLSGISGPVRELVWTYRDSRRGSADRMRYAALVQPKVVSGFIPSGITFAIDTVTYNVSPIDLLNSPITYITLEHIWENVFYGPAQSRGGMPGSVRGNVVYCSYFADQYPLEYFDNEDKWIGPIALPMTVRMGGVEYTHVFVLIGNLGGDVCFWRRDLPIPTVDCVSGCRIRCEGLMQVYGVCITLTDTNDPVTTHELYPTFQTSSQISQTNGFVIRLELQWSAREITVWPFSDPAIDSVVRVASLGLYRPTDFSRYFFSSSGSRMVPKSNNVYDPEYGQGTFDPFGVYWYPKNNVSSDVHRSTISVDDNSTVQVKYATDYALHNPPDQYTIWHVYVSVPLDNVVRIALNSPLRLLGDTYRHAFVTRGQQNVVTVRFGNDSVIADWSPTLVITAPAPRAWAVRNVSILPTTKLNPDFEGPVSPDPNWTIVCVHMRFPTQTVSTAYRDANVSFCFQDEATIIKFTPDPGVPNTASYNRWVYQWKVRGFSYSNTASATRQAIELDITPRYMDFFEAGSVFFNGGLRFTPRPPEHFRISEPYRRHRRAPDKQVYCHSFALRPEEDGPSGHANFSVLHNPSLHLEHPAGLQAGSLRVYARTHNVLRVRHGTAHLVFTA